MFWCIPGTLLGICVGLHFAATSMTRVHPREIPDIDRYYIYRALPNRHTFLYVFPTTILVSTTLIATLSALKHAFPATLEELHQLPFIDFGLLGLGFSLGFIISGQAFSKDAYKHDNSKNISAQIANALFAFVTRPSSWYSEILLDKIRNKVEALYEQDTDNLQVGEGSWRYREGLPTSFRYLLVSFKIAIRRKEPKEKSKGGKGEPQRGGVIKITQNAICHFKQQRKARRSRYSRRTRQRFQILYAREKIRFARYYAIERPLAYDEILNHTTSNVHFHFKVAVGRIGRGKLLHLLKTDKSLNGLKCPNDRTWKGQRDQNPNPNPKQEGEPTDKFRRPKPRGIEARKGLRRDELEHAPKRAHEDTKLRQEILGQSTVDLKDFTAEALINGGGFPKADGK